MTNLQVEEGQVCKAAEGQAQGLQGLNRWNALSLILKFCAETQVAKVLPLTYPAASRKVEIQTEAKVC